MEGVRFWPDKLKFCSQGVGVTLKLDDILLDCASGDGSRIDLLLWAQIAATREQTEAIREFTRFVEKQTAATHVRAKELTPEKMLDLAMERFPGILAALQSAGGAPVADATGPRTIRHGKNGETDSVS